MSGEISRLDNGSTLSQKPLNKVHSYLLKTGFNFYLNDKNTFSFYTRQNLWKTRETNAINATYTKGTAPDREQETDTKAGRISRVYDLDYKREFAKKDHSLEYEVRYAQHEWGGHTDFYFPISGSGQDYRDQLNRDAYNAIMNLDYSDPIGEHAKLELGLESRTSVQTDRYRGGSGDVKDADYRYKRDEGFAHALSSKKTRPESIKSKCFQTENSNEINEK